MEGGPEAMSWIFMSKGELYHHGILGQKWGKRNGPPYPLGQGDHSASEKKAGWRKSLGSNSEEVSKRKKRTVFEDENVSKISATKSSSGQEKDSVSPALTMDDNEFRDYILKVNPNAAILGSFGEALSNKKETDDSSNIETSKFKSFVRDHKKEIIVGGLVLSAVAASVIAYKVTDLNAKKDLLSWQAKNIATGPLEKHIVGEQKLGTVSHFGSQSERYIAGWLHSNKYRFEPISERDLANFSTKGFTLNKDTELYRLSKNRHNSLRDGIEYVSFGEDRDRYRGFLPRLWKSNSYGQYDGNTAYEMVLNLKNEIKAPSKRETFDLFEQAIKDLYPDKDAHKQCLRSFNALCLNLCSRGDPVSNKFFDLLKGAGYNAVVDYNDAGRLAQQPLIIVDASKNLGIKNIETITKDISDTAFKRITPVVEYSDFSEQKWDNMLNTMGLWERTQYEDFLKQLSA